GPALAACRTSLSDGMKDGGRTGESRATGRTRSVLVVAQVAISVLLLIGAGLLGRSLHLLGSMKPGFHPPPHRRLTMLLSPIGPRYAAPRPVDGKPQPNLAVAGYWEQVVARVRQIPGVEAASVAVTIPPDRVSFTDGYEIEGKEAPPGSNPPAVPI